MPRIPATKTKSPARVPTAHVPVVLIAPSGASVLTPWGEDDWASTAVAPPAKIIAAIMKFRMFAPPTVHVRMKLEAVFAILNIAAKPARAASDLASVPGSLRVLEKLRSPPNY